MNPAEKADQRSFVLMRIGRHRFALPARVVAELAPPVRLHAFPHTSPLIMGVIVRRGRIVPVYDAATMLVGRASSAQRFYLIARSQIGKTGDSGAIPMNGECELATGEMHAPAAGRPAYVAGTLLLGEESVDVLDFAALVAHGLQAGNESHPMEAQP